MREIGSDFWDTEAKQSDVRFFLAGRTALEFIVRDILAQRKVDTVWLPSYCCHTMIEPFVRHGLTVKFYDIWFDDEQLRAQQPPVNQDDVLFVMSYFGYADIPRLKWDAIEKSGCTVIEDTTHSWLVRQMDCMPDYRFASYRKWTGFTGVASAEKCKGAFCISQKDIPHTQYEAIRREAERQKEHFIATGCGDKNAFLRLYGQAEDMLDTDYVDYAPSDDSLYRLWNLDTAIICSKRRENAKVLLQNLQNVPEITLLFKEMRDVDVPLHVPILTDATIRNDLRKYLIGQKIYCPVHWPLSELHHGLSERALGIYRTELSLVCDQRYDVEDMERIAACIRTYFKR